jgi:hypothetical protein
MVQQQNSIIGLMNHQTISMIKFIKNKEKFLNVHTSSYKYIPARYLILLIIYQWIAKVRKNLIFAQATNHKGIASTTYATKEMSTKQVYPNFWTDNKEERKLWKI